jgi:uncharacterized protein YoxC
MAEIEIGDVKMSGSKMLLLIPILGTLIGGAWGAFEVYQRLLDAEQAIQEYVAPDMSSINEQLAVLEVRAEELTSEVNRVENYVSRESRRLGGNITNIETLARAVDKNTAETQRELRNDVYGLETRVNEDIRTTRQDLKDLEKSLEEKIQKLLDNPLNNED